MKNSIMILFLVGVLMLGTVHAAQNNSNVSNQGNTGPFDNLASILADIDSKIQSIPGPQGQAGPQGQVGPQGPIGPQGNVTVNIATGSDVTPKYHIFLLLNGIPGESTDANHMNWIEVLNYGYNIATPIDPASGQGTGRSTSSGFSITKFIDISSPNIFMAEVQGRHIQNATIDVVKDGNVIIEYKLTDVLVSSYQLAGNSMSAMSRPTEAITFNFQKFEVQYNQFDNGNVINYALGSWDLHVNV